MHRILALVLDPGLLQEVPADVAQGQLEAALEAGVETGSGAMGAVDPLTVSPILLFVLLVVLGVLVVLQRMDGGRTGAGAGLAPAAAPTEAGEEPPGQERRRRRRRVRPAPEPVALPPHVAAMLQRVAERQASGHPGERLDPPDDGEGGSAPPSPGRLDVWVS